MARTLHQGIFYSCGRTVASRPAEFIVLSVLAIMVIIAPFCDFTYRPPHARHVRLWTDAQTPKRVDNVWTQKLVFKGDNVVSKEVFQKVYDFQTQLEETAIVFSGKVTSIGELCAKVNGNSSTGKGPCFTKNPLHLWGMNMENFLKDDNILKTIQEADSTVRDLAFGAPLSMTEIENLTNLTVTYVMTSEKAAFSVWPQALDTVLSSTTLVRRSPESGSPTRVYYWEEKTKSPEVLILGLCNTITVLYVYATFGKMHRIGSKYVLGVAGLMTMSGSFILTIGLFHSFSVPFTLVISEVVPFLYILIGLENAYMISKYVTHESFRRMRKAQSGTSDTTNVDICELIGEGLAACGPSIAVDCLFKFSVMLAGRLTGIKILEQACMFAIVTLIANHILLVTLYLPVLTLKLEHSRLVMQQPNYVSELSQNRPLSSLNQLYHFLQQQQDDNQYDEEPEIDKGKLWSMVLLLVLSAAAPFLRATSTKSSDIRTYPLPDLFYNQTIGLNLARNYTTFSAAGAYEVIVCVLKEQCMTAPLTILHYCHEVVGNNNLCQHLEGTILGAVEAEQAVLLYVFVLSLFIICKYVWFDVDRTIGTPTSTSSPSDSPPPPIKKENRDTLTNELSMQRKDERPMFTMGETPESTPVSPSASTTDLPRAAAPNISVTADCPIESDETAPRPVSECETILKQGKEGASLLTDREMVELIKAGVIPAYNVEKICNDHTRGVRIRRMLTADHIRSNHVKGFDVDTMSTLPYLGMDYTEVGGVCCENVIGYIPVPVGVVGPMLLNGEHITIPMATTEGALLASTQRGCKAIAQSGGADSMIIKEGMTRAPVLRLPSAKQCVALKYWLDDQTNYTNIKEAFESTSRFAKLQSIDAKVAGRHIYLRFITLTGDAMGMNMISKGTERALSTLMLVFPDMEILSLSGNYCTDKKPAAVNWIEGRGKSVVAEAVIKGEIVRKTLKTTVQSLVEVNIAKNLIGSAMAGSIGGFNAHAANVVTALYIACGQDPAQNVESSQCITIMEAVNGGRDLHISCTMPSIEVGTVGGGTQLPAQATCLRIMGIQGANRENPGDNSRQLAKVVCAAVMAGELSLMAALAAGHLVKSHMTHNRSLQNLASAAEISEKEERYRRLQAQLSNLSSASNLSEKSST